MSVNAVGFNGPVSTITVRLVVSPSNAHEPDAVPVPTAHAIVTAFVTQSEDGDVDVIPVHDVPVNAVVDGVSIIVSPTTALL